MARGARNVYGVLSRQTNERGNCHRNPHGYQCRFTFFLAGTYTAENSDRQDIISPCSKAKEFYQAAVLLAAIYLFAEYFDQLILAFPLLIGVGIWLIIKLTPPDQITDNWK